MEEESNCKRTSWIVVQAQACGDSKLQLGTKHSGVKERATARSKLMEQC